MNNPVVLTSMILQPQAHGYVSTLKTIQLTWILATMLAAKCSGVYSEILSQNYTHDI